MSQSSIATKQSGPLRGQSPEAEIPRSTFDRSHGYKTTINAGQLYPFFVDEVLPGDTFNLKTAGLCRLSTPIFPVMDNLYLETFYFYIPTRLVWDNFQKMMGEQKSPGDSTDYLAPIVVAPAGGFAQGSLADYFGIPTNIGNLAVVSLAARAYNLVWNEFFRDENLQTPVNVPTGDGPDTWTEIYYPLRRGKRHDYFTSCLPWPQKGPNVPIPVGGLSPITGLGVAPGATFAGSNTAVKETSNARSGAPYVNSTTGTNLLVNATGASSSDYPAIYAILNAAVDGGNNAPLGTINSLRQAYQIQKMYERDARGGTRYTEILRAHFGVVSPDARLQRPEYLGGGHTPVSINPIYSTAETQDAVIGRLSGVGVASFGNHGFTKSFTEHGYVIGLVNVRADISYQQGMNRMFKRRDKLDYYWPALSHIGEQVVNNDEIYASNNATQNEAAFGYQERYAEYRYKPSVITGKFRSNATGTLDAWHLAQNFTALPVLNGGFIQDNPPVARVVAVPDEPNFVCDFYHKLTCTRPMPMFGIPGMSDHF